MIEQQPLRPLHDWRDQTTLVPFSGIQFLDFGFDEQATGFKRMEFVERVAEVTDEGERRELIVLSGDDKQDDIRLGTEQVSDDRYSINQAKALEPFLDQWTPVPVLRIRHRSGPDAEETYDSGPTCWARVLVKAVPSEGVEHGLTHRVVLAMDTGCEASESPLFYNAPRLDDGERRFRFVSSPDHIDWFVCRLEEQDGELYDLQDWVDEWLQAQFDAVSKKRSSVADEDEQPRLFEHWARFFAFLAMLDQSVAFPSIRLIDTMSRDQETERYRYTPIDVDLVVDIGNSHTCGILIESAQDGGAVDLNDSYTLALRDLSNPLYRYNEPFESRIEFSDARFGSGRAARHRSFFWPSLVRVGPEAMRLTRFEQGTETISGLSSPKRYLWDNEARSQDWRFHFFEPNAAEPLPLIARAVQNEMNEAGDVLDQVKAEIKAKLRLKHETSLIGASRPRFSRSSTFGLMLAEIFLQALVQINDPAQRETRKQSVIPRRLRTIILTLPAATPIQEQAIMRSRAEGALKLLFRVLKWSPSLAFNTVMPEIKVDWDEASCTQMVYLYTEINQRFGGQIRGFFDLMGERRPRKNSESHESSLRLGCMDIGGGTTDLMVMSYFVAGEHAIVPEQAFREGFRTAGDDLLHNIISRLVLPQIAAALGNSGVVHADSLIKELFGGDVGDTDIRVYQRRRQYVLRMLMPIAVHCLSVAENLEPDESVSFHATEVTAGGSGAAPEFFAYLDQPARSRGGANWHMCDLKISLDRREFDRIVRDVLQKPISDLCEIVGHLGCDVLLLSGRPSRLAAVRDLVRETMAVAPSRLISMHDYVVGGWYPYRDPITNRIRDPKSSAAVGAMLCLLSQSRIVNYMVYTDRMRMTSTARFIGLLDTEAGGIRRERVLLSDEDGANETAQIELYAPTFIGFRQLPHERWTTSVLYRVDFANAQVASRPKPFVVKLERREFDTDPDKDSPTEILRAEALKEGLIVTDVEDGDQSPLKATDVTLKLHTIGTSDEYWLDSGLFSL